MLIEFRDIGRDKKTFTVEMKNVNYESMLRAVRPHLGSGEVEFYDDENGVTGRVVVGGFRTVGKFRYADKVDIAEQLLADAGLSKAWKMYRMFEDESPEKVSENVKAVVEIINKIIETGKLSPIRASSLIVALELIRSGHAATSGCPNGRRNVIGTPITAMKTDTAFGEAYQWIVKSDRGFVVLGTVPEPLVELIKWEGNTGTVEPGTRVGFTARVIRSHSRFGIYERPTKSYIEEEPTGKG